MIHYAHMVQNTCPECTELQESTYGCVSDNCPYTILIGHCVSTSTANSLHLSSHFKHIYIVPTEYTAQALLHFVHVLR